VFMVHTGTGKQERGTYVPGVGKDWYDRIRKPDGWVPIDVFNLHSLDDVKRLLVHPHSYSFYYTNKLSCMCVMFYMDGNVLGASCAIHRSSIINKAHYHANGEYLGCIPYKHAYNKYAHMFDRLFFTIYRNVLRSVND